jgi:hypothetical protein
MDHRVKPLSDLPELVKYDCGCIGFRKGPEGSALKLYHCDALDDPYGIRMRAVSPKHAEPVPVSAEEAAEVWLRLVDLVDKGQRFEELKKLLD